MTKFVLYHKTHNGNKLVRNKSGEPLLCNSQEDAHVIKRRFFPVHQYHNVIIQEVEK